MAGAEQDLLRQATQAMMARDEDGDHIDSDTPRSGVATHSQILQTSELLRFEAEGALLKATPSSLDERRIDGGVEKENSLLPPHELLGSSQISKQQYPYPTPPVSHPSSLHKVKLSDASFEDIGNNVQKTAAPTDRDCISESIPSHARRASSMTPLSNIVTPSNSIPSTPTRALSNQTSKSDQSVMSTNSEHVAQNGKSGASERPAVTPRTDSSMGGTVVPPKGKLTVKINEARGLRRSVDPYVVAVFQRNELVSKGPQSEEDDEDDGNSHSPGGIPIGGIPIGGIPITRSGSDSGRSMAIPMKSRQSSNTSLSEYRDFKNKGRKMFTHPKWDAEAVFDVVGSDTRVNITIYDRAQQAEEFLGMQANFKGFTFVDESSIEENMKDRIKDEYEDRMDQDNNDPERDWEDPFDIPDKSRMDRMSGVVRNHNEDERMFNGDDFH
ncbi:hypothetical protein H4I96_11416 [Botrytis cinerea]